MSEPRVVRGFRSAAPKRPAALFYRVIDGPRMMKDGWRDISGKLLRNPIDVQKVASWDDWQIALLPGYQHSIVIDDGKLIKRAQTSDSGSHPTEPSQRPMPVAPEVQRVISAYRRVEGAADAVTVRGRQYYGCRGLATD